MREKIIRKAAMVLSFLFSGILFFGGCTGTNLSIETVKSGDSADYENGIENSLEEANDDIEMKADGTGVKIEKDGDSGSGESDEKGKNIETDNSYIFEGICKVSDTYEECENMAPIDIVVSELRKETYKRLILLNHSVEEKDGKTIDNISYKIETANPTDMVQQLILCEASFEKDGDTWNLVSKEWNDWTIKSLSIRGNDWHLKDASKDLSKWFGSKEKITNSSDVYIHVKKDLSFIGALKNDLSIFETNVSTKFSGSIYLVNGEEKKEVSFTCTEGVTDDDGNLSLKLVTDFGEDYFTPGDYEYVTKRQFNEVTSDNPEEYAEAVSFDTLDTFDVTSESLVYGEWKKECGANHGNISPELSWEEAEGANEYAIMMVDPDNQDFILHWVGTVDTNHSDAGLFDKETGYTGPFPPSTHEYTVYVFALRNKTKNLGLTANVPIYEMQKLIDQIEKDSPGNIISYGKIKGSYEYVEKVW